MIDPPRPEAEQAVALCRQAGIRPVMITGDHVITASAIARELGILRAGDRAITGAELDSMDEDTLRREVEQISVYARVSPENKIRIVKANYRAYGILQPEWIGFAYFMQRYFKQGEVARCIAPYSVKCECYSSFRRYPACKGNSSRLHNRRRRMRYCLLLCTVYQSA